MRYILLLAILIFAGIGTAQAQHDQNPDAMHNVKERILRIAEKLEFNDDQRAETRALLQDSFADLKVIKEEMGANMEAIKALAEDPDYDADSVAELARSQGELFAQQLEIRMATRVAFHEILTDEQKARLEAFKDQREERKDFLRDQRRERREHCRQDRKGA